MDEFASLYANNPEFEAGRGSGVGMALKHASAGVDRFIESTGLPKATGAVGAYLPMLTGFGDGPNEEWRSAFRSLPRGAATTATMLVPGAGPVLGGALMGIDTYEKTNSPLAGSVAGVLGSLMPFAGKLGGNVAAGLAGRFASRETTNAATATIAGQAVPLAVGGLYKSAAMRAAEFAGQQAGYLAAGLTTQGVTNAIVAPDGSGWDAFTSAFTPANIALTTATIVPFAVNDVLRLRQNSRAARTASETEATMQRYDADVMEPLRRVERVRNDLQAATNVLALPWTGSETTSVAESQARLSQLAARNEAVARNNQRQADLPLTGKIHLQGRRVPENRSALPDYMTQPVAEPTTPAMTVAEAYRAAQREQAYEAGLLRSVSRQAPPEVQAKLVEARKTTPLADRVVADNPQVKIDALIEQSGRDVNVLTEQIVEKVAAGEDVATATTELIKSLEAEVTRAAAVEQRRATQSEPPDEPPAAKAARMAAWTEAFDRATVRFADNAAVKAKLSESLEIARESDQAEANDNILRAVAVWEQKSRGKTAEDLITELRRADSTNRLAPVAKGADKGKTLSALVDNVPVFQHRKAMRFATEVEAKSVALQLKAYDDSFAWQAEKASGEEHWIVRRYPFEYTAIGARAGEHSITEMQLDAIAAGEQLKSDAPESIVLSRATRAEERAAAKIATALARDEDAIGRFIDRGLRDEATQELLVDLGVDRVELLLRLQSAEPSDKPRWRDGLIEMFGSKQAVNEWIALPETQMVLNAWKRASGQAKASGEVKKMVSDGATQTEYFVGEQMSLSRLLKTVGLDDTWIDEASRLVTLFDNSDITYASLAANSDVAGLFTVQRDGQKLVWLSQSKSPRRTLYALTHELNGHALWRALEEGRLDGETTHRLQQFERFVTDNTPETNRVLLKELWRHLPNEYRKDAGLKKLIDSTANDPAEVIANINAIASLNLVHSSRSAWSKLMTYLPKPLADLLAVMARTGRRMFEAINGALFLREHGWATGKVNAEARKQLGTYIDDLYGVLRLDKERATDAARMLRTGLLYDADARFAAVSNPDYWIPTSTAESDVLQALGLWKRKDKAGLLPEGSVGLTNMFGPNGAWGVKYPWMRRLLNTYSRQQATAALVEKEVFRELGFERKGFKIKARDEPTNAILQVEKSLPLAEARDRLIQRANVAQQTVTALLTAKDADAMAALNGLSAADVSTVRSAIAQHEAANSKQNAYVRDLQYDRLKFITAQALLHGKMAGDFATAETLSAQLIAAQRSGQPFAGTSPAASMVDFVAKAAARIEENHAWFESRPYFVSYRRFGKFSASVKFSDGRAEESRSFDSQDARDRWLAPYRTDSAATIRHHKKEFRKDSFSDEVMALLQEREGRNLDGLINSLVANGMARDVADNIVAQFSTYGEVARELAAAKLPNAAPKRRFVKGYEELNATEQQTQYLQMLAHGIARGVHDAEFNALVADPKHAASPDIETIKQQWRQTKEQDSPTTKLVRKSGYVMHMMLHATNMIQDALQPVLGALPAWMINDGRGVVESYESVAKAMKDRRGARDLDSTTAQKKLTADERRMLRWFQDSNQGLASYSDEANNEALQFHSLHALAKGRRSVTLGQMLGNVAGSAMLHMKQAHRFATDFAMEAGMLAAYRWQRAQGKNHNDAQASAFDLVMPAMAAQGKGGRAQGVWNSGVFKPLSASMTLLQSFGMNQLFTAKHSLERALGRVEGLTPKQRIDATKAFAVTLATSTLTAGIMGTIVAGPMLTIIDKLFGINSREAIADFLRGDDDDEYDDIVQQVAMHGMFSWSGGPDVGAKQAVGSFLGFNGYDGWSLETMAGAGYDIVKRIFTLPMKLREEGIGALTNVAPQPLRRGLEMWKNDWEFRRKDGTLIDESTPWEQSVYAVFGVKPTNVANTIERDTWQRLDSQNDIDARDRWTNEMLDMMDDGDFAGVRDATIARAAQRTDEKPDIIAHKLAERYIQRLYGTNASRRAGFNARLARTTSGDAMTEVQRLTAEDRVRQLLNMGYATTPQQLQEAQMIDRLRQLNPGLSVKEARAFMQRRPATFNVPMYRAR